MGCAASRGVNPIDAALLQALIEAKKRRNLQHLTFNELLLKFPKARPGATEGAPTAPGASQGQRQAAAAPARSAAMAAGFRKARSYFDMLDLNGDRVIDMREFTSQARRAQGSGPGGLQGCVARAGAGTGRSAGGPAGAERALRGGASRNPRDPLRVRRRRARSPQAHKLGLSMDLEDLRNVFDAADIDHSMEIDVFEFVLVFVVVHLLSPERAAALPPEITTTLEIVEDAFCCFDASADGYLERTEVEAALCTNSTPGRADRPARAPAAPPWPRRAPQEFLIGLEKMVMEEYEDGGEEDEEAAAARREEEAALLAASRRVRQQQQQQAAARRGASGAGSSAQRSGKRSSGSGGGSGSHGGHGHGGQRR
ncbi:CML21 [Scenedesmus sp. PABB004]|nr:CML21 [Scenedesmus sp. PABB004]